MTTIARAPRAAAAATTTTTAPRASRRRRRRRRVDPSSRALPPARAPRRHRPSGIVAVIENAMQCTARAARLPDRARTDSIRRPVASPRVARVDELAKTRVDRLFRADERRALARTTERRIGIASPSNRDNGRPRVSYDESRFVKQSHPRPAGDRPIDRPTDRPRATWKGLVRGS